jgi:hypothetical protein
MTSAAAFDHLHGQNAFADLLTLLKNPELSYTRIGKKFGLTRQRISQLAHEIGIDANERIRVRELNAAPVIIEKGYSPEIAAVITKIKRAGLPVRPYLAQQPGTGTNVLRKSQTKIFVNGRLCAIRIRPLRKYRPDGRYYVRFDTYPKSGADVLILVTKADRMKLHVIPRSDLRNVSSIYIPGDGTYHPQTGRIPARDWTRYENAWHLLRELAQQHRKPRTRKINPPLRDQLRPRRIPTR